MEDRVTPVLGDRKESLSAAKIYKPSLAGIRVALAFQDAEAMNKLGLIGGVDAVVIDVGLPDRRGDVLLAEIRAIYPSLPIVLATGESVGGLREKFESEEHVAFVSKPYTAENLLGALQGVGLVPHRPDT